MEKKYASLAKNLWTHENLKYGSQDLKKSVEYNFKLLLKLIFGQWKTDSW